MSNSPDLPSTPVKQTGVRVTHITPDKVCPELMRTPGGTAIKPVYGHRLFVPVTPEQVKPVAPDPQTLSGSRYGRRVKARHFHATAETIGSKGPRRLSQRQLTGISCKALFRAHGFDTDSDLHSQFHWSHLIAWFLGGDHHISNLAPGTAESNLNTLHAVERRIRDLLNRGVPGVDIHVTPHYPADLAIQIPEQLHFSLTWEERGLRRHEEIRIYPQSRSVLNRSMRSTLEQVREDFDATDPGMSGFGFQ